MSYAVPPIIRLSERLLVDVEEAVKVFPRRHKYVFGSDLRRAAMKVALRAQRAWRKPRDPAKRIAKLVRAIDDFKLRLQLGSAIRAFASFGQFEALARLAKDIGRQAGGWMRRHQQHPKSQNRAAGAPPERAQTLSTCAASRHTGANA
ncbi:MAG: four helix bundle protein [Dokdonella sp.]|nr:four helix bundle protein [Dokdonella sp.]